MSNCRVENGQDRGSKSSIWSLSWAQYVDICTERCGKWPDHWLTMRQNSWRHAADWTVSFWASLEVVTLHIPSPKVPGLPVIDMIENHTSGMFFFSVMFETSIFRPEFSSRLGLFVPTILGSDFPQKKSFSKEKTFKKMGLSLSRYCSMKS